MSAATTDDAGGRLVGLLPYVRDWLLGAPRKSPDRDFGGVRADRTGRLNTYLTILGLAMVGVMAIYARFGLTENQGRLNFFAWGVIAAFAAFLVGIALGMLFGLPSTRGWSARKVTPQGKATGAGGDPAQPGAPATQTETIAGGGGVTPATAVMGLDDFDIPYDENTSLEQIADWLTKIIVGLSLTQFDDWKQEFGAMAVALSGLMLGPGARADGTAGGLVLIAFSVQGFLMAYLWMRRHFISEMVIARRNAVDVLRAEARLAEQKILTEAETKAELRRFKEHSDLQAEKQKIELEKQIADLRMRVTTYQPAPPLPTAIAAQSGSTLMTQVRERLALPGLPAVQESLNAIESAPETDPEDPWKGRFGGSAEAGGYRVTGRVSKADGVPNLFSIDLEVRAVSGDARGDAAGRLSAFFFLHPTFNSTVQRVAFNTEGIAPVRLLGYGAFTVGVLIENGVTLELNLAGLESAKDFPIFLAS